MPRLIGRPIRRVEDARLLTGRGRYTDDHRPEGACHAALVRSPHAHARIVSVDTAAARAAPGVLAVLTAADYAADGLQPIRHTPIPADALDAARPSFVPDNGGPVLDLPHWPLAAGRARMVGEPVALVIAETLSQAQDAAELVEVAYEALPAVVTAAQALAPGAPALWEEAPGNLAMTRVFGDVAATDAAFAQAPCVVEVEVANSRMATAQMEPRAAIGAWDAARGVFQLVAGSQGAVRQRMDLARCLGVPPERVEVVCPDTGGGFGSRTNLHPEAVLVAWAARRLGRPVRWAATRSEGFLTDYAARDLLTRGALALDGDGRILAFRIELVGNCGAQTVSYVPLSNGYRVSPTVYAVPVATARLTAALTNTAPTAPFRGAGRPEATHVMERLLDLAAARLGLDRAEIRRRNLVPRGALPWRNAFGLTFDSGDFRGNMARALEMAGWDGFAARRAASEARGRLRGIGVANYVESPVGAPRERVALRALADGTVELLVGTQSTGQGHETSFAQVVAETLGVEMAAIRFVAGDTRRIAVGGGSHSDRSMRLAGTLMVEAGAKLLEAARTLAAARLGVAADAVTAEEGVLRHAAGNRAFTLAELARDAPGEAIEAAAEMNGRIPAYPTGCAVCELEVEPETGAVAILRWTSLDDVGQPVNPMIVDGQVHGGIVQGVGQGLFEWPVYDPETGQAVAGSFMDYALPRASDVPAFAVALAEDPTAGNPLRVKGGGESGITPATAALFNALHDALAPLGVRDLPMPATPFRIWQAIRDAKEKAA